jgi:uncharacterized protein (UPF0332 family)
VRLMVVAESVRKARGFLNGAKAALNVGEGDSCACLCYHAVFWAAIGILGFVGVRRARWKHDELRQVFGLECIKKRRLCSPELGETLNKLYDLRVDAVYKSEAVAPKKAERAFRWAESFVKFVQEVCQQ